MSGLESSANETARSPLLVVTLNPALDLTIELAALEPGAVNRASSTQLAAAGKGLNVARVLASLGHRVVLSGFLGADNDAAFVAACREHGIEDASLRLPGETRINAKVAEANGRVTDINGPGVAVSTADLERLTRELVSRCDNQRPAAVVITGSLPPGVSPAALATLIATLKASGVPVWVDTSGAALAAALEVAPTAAKPNEHELAEWAGGALDDFTTQCEAARRLHAAGVEEALVSLGEAGVLWVSRRGEWFAEAPAVEVVSTVGAGDTLVAAMLHGIVEQGEPAAVLGYAAALAAESVRHIGVGDPNASDLSQLNQRTRVSRFDAASHAGESA
ncbi:1-phosphofructokinase [Salinicola aestuarinus]|uniref:1-phosphofructokinase n=1 Tax=Salinicola aestuarinus TaxID=1949082 RepID=UPI000DA22671|nr:1-phosphofructokinase [Salinicola aestuarinus]